MYRACVGKRVRYVRFVRSVRCVRCARCVRCVRHVRIVRPSVAPVCVRAPVRREKNRAERENRKREKRKPKSRRAEAQTPPTQTKPTQTQAEALEASSRATNSRNLAALLKIRGASPSDPVKRSNPANATKKQIQLNPRNLPFHALPSDYRSKSLDTQNLERVKNGNHENGSAQVF